MYTSHHHITPLSPAARGTPPDRDYYSSLLFAHTTFFARARGSAKNSLNRGHRHDAHKAAGMMRQMLQWRKDNGVDAIREDIMQNQKFHPRLVRSDGESYNSCNICMCLGCWRDGCVWPTPFKRLVGCVRDLGRILNFPGPSAKVHHLRRKYVKASERRD